MTQVDQSIDRLNEVLDQLDDTLDVKAKAISAGQPDLFGGASSATAANGNAEVVDQEQLATVTECLDRTIERVEALLKEGA